MPYADRVKETTNVTSTETITLIGAAGSGFRRVAAVFDVGTEGIRFGVEDDNGNWENGVYTLSSANELTRTAILSSSNNGGAVAFPAGIKRVSAILAAADISSFVSKTEGLAVSDLQSLSNLLDTDLIAVNRPGLGDYKVAASVLKSYVGATATPPADTTAPVFPDSLTSSNVTQTSFTLGWSAATDANGIARYEYSYDGNTWTTAGTALSVNLTGRTAGTTYTMRVRAIDPSGNISTVRTLAVTTVAAAPSGDTTAPVMSGSITTSAITSSGYTFSWPAATDNVGVDHYETSVDNGSSFQSSGTSLSRTVTGRPASTTDNLRVRAHDATGNISNILSATVTTSAETVVAYTIAPNGSNTLAATLGAPTTEYADSWRYGASSQSTTGFWNITPKPASARSGWSDSPTVPPAEITQAQNTAGASSINGLTPMSNPSAWGNNSALMTPKTPGIKRYFWIKPVDGAAQCMNPAGTTITGP